MPERSTRRKIVWLAAAVALLGASAWLMSRGDRERPTARAPKVEFPRYPRDHEYQRNQRRRTLLPPPAQADDDRGARRDPLLVALPVDPKRSALVFEVDALKESPIGKLWLDCMLARTDDRRGLASLEETLGFDPLRDVERVAVSSDSVAIFQGSFGGARMALEGWTRRSYGEHGIIFDNGATGGVVASWGAELMFAGGDSAAVEEAIDRLESTAEEAPSILSPSSSYGDIYGVLSPEDLAKALPDEQSGLAEKIQSIVERVEVHVDASEDVAMVADIGGSEAEPLADSAKSMGTALALGRLKAQSDGDEVLADLLDYARVQPGQGQFAVDVVLPVELLKNLGPCRVERRERDAVR